MPAAPKTSMTPRERLCAALAGRQRDRTPVLPIFMQWAAHHISRTYRDYYLHAHVLADAQIAVARTFNLDQVSAISDPWREAEAFGMKLDYPEQGVGIPRGYVIRSREDAANLKLPDITASARMADRVEAVRLMARRLGQTHSVLGWVEGPIAQYVDLRGMQEAMLDLVDAPDMFHAAAGVITQNAILFAKAQIEAGADMIGVGDAAASLIGPELYRRHVLPWQKKLFAAIHDAGAAVRLHICGNIRRIIADMATAGPDVIDVDSMVPLAEARAAVGPDVTLCGNFDPTAVLLQGTPERVADFARRCIADAGDRFALMPGCEVPPGTPEANIRAFCPCAGCLL